MNSSQKLLAWLVLPLLLAIVDAAGTAEPQDWPLTYQRDGVQVTLYPPQVDQWSEYQQLSGRLAVTLTPAGAKKPAVGAVWFETQTKTDLPQRLVTFLNFKITRSKFPALDTTAASQMDGLIKSLVPQNGLTIGLERLLPQLEAKGPATGGVALKNDPPAIFVSQKPAVLLLINGQPVWTEVKGTDIKYCVNAGWDLFHHKAGGRYYLLVNGKWLAAQNLTEVWQPAGELPDAFSHLPAEDTWNVVRQQVTQGQKQGFTPPLVFVSQPPAELLVFTGPPQFTVIRGISLYYATNTDSPLFFCAADQSFYLLLAGRWFRTPLLTGPWSPVLQDLPDDFARIPPDHPRAFVLAAVPGTEAAEETAITAQIPQMAKVKRQGTTAAAVYDGMPKFAPISGTSLSYAVNTPNLVIKVGSRYYMCDKGVWFVSDSPQGPWVVADAVPSEIYLIPPSSPVYPATFVKVYDSTADEVLVGFLAGYLGAYLANTGTVVYGTGYYYPPYIAGSVYYPPLAYTYGATAVYNPYRGAFVPVAGSAVYGPYYGAGGAAYYNPATGTYVRGGSAYSPYGSASYLTAYNPYTGAFAYGATGSGVYGRATAVGAYNPWTGTYAATQQAATPYAHWGHSVVSQGSSWVQTGHYVGSQGAAAGFATSTGAAGVVAKGPQHQGGAVKTSSGDMYVGVDGNLYKHTDSGWYQYQNGSWSQVQTPASQANSSTQKTAPASQPVNPAQKAAPTAKAATGQTQAAKTAPSASPLASGLTQTIPQKSAGSPTARTASPAFSPRNSQSSLEAREAGKAAPPDALANLQKERHNRQKGQLRTQHMKKPEAKGQTARDRNGQQTTAKHGRNRSNGSDRPGGGFRRH